MSRYGRSGASDPWSACTCKRLLPVGSRRSLELRQHVGGRHHRHRYDKTATNSMSHHSCSTIALVVTAESSGSSGHRLDTVTATHPERSQNDFDANKNIIPGTPHQTRAPPPRQRRRCYTARQVYAIFCNTAPVAARPVLVYAATQTARPASCAPARSCVLIHARTCSSISYMLVHGRGAG